MLHPDTELRFVSDQIGYGVFATRTIPRGTLTWVRDRFDQSFTREQAASLPKALQQILYRYAYLDRDRHIVLCWDLARYVNHSCQPTCLTTPVLEVEVALCDIAAGEQLTDDYSLLNLVNPFPCACGQPECRREIHPDDPARRAEILRSQFAAAFAELEQVPQPLWQMLDDPQPVLRSARAPGTVANWW